MTSVAPCAWLGVVIIAVIVACLEMFGFGLEVLKLLV